jgi:hypothetical protein
MGYSKIKRVLDIDERVLAIGEQEDCPEGAIDLLIAELITQLLLLLLRCLDFYWSSPWFFC